MEKESCYIDFIPKSYIDTKENDICLIIKDGKFLLISEEYKLRFPRFKEAKELKLEFKNPETIGALRNIDYHMCEYVKHEESDKIIFRDLRSLIGEVDLNIFNMIGRATLLQNWSRNNKYCGRCGSLMGNKADETAKHCDNCDYLVYPRLSPAIIVAITKGDEILLAHNKNFPAKRYSIIAGYVEAGESFEESVKREVMEEVGIKIKNIKYYGSQLWAFPDSMMIGFTAEYESGEIQVDNKEILHADFYNKDTLPDLPLKGSIARRLIDEFIQ